MGVAEWVDIYGIHPWRTVWSSYRKLAWVGFEPTTNDFVATQMMYGYIKYQVANRLNFITSFEHAFSCSKAGSTFWNKNHNIKFRKGGRLGWSFILLVEKIREEHKHSYKEQGEKSTEKQAETNKKPPRSNKQQAKCND